MDYDILISEICLLPDNDLDTSSIWKLPETKQEITSDSTVESEIKPEIKEKVEKEELISKPTIIDTKTNKLKPRVILNPANFTVVEMPKMLSQPINKTPVMLGGNNQKIDVDKAIKLIYNASPSSKLYSIVMYYLKNEHEYLSETQKIPKIISKSDLINVLVSIIYNEFTETNNKLEDIISSKYIDEIPEMYKFNFQDKVILDLSEKCSNINEKFLKLNKNVDKIKILVKSMYANNIQEIKQSGGKSKKKLNNSNDKTIDEKIRNKIASVSLALQNKQTGGLVTLTDMSNEIDRFPANTKDKMIIRDMQEKANMWVIELIEQNLATKIIKDNEYNIARFYLQKNPTAVLDNKVLNFINNNASILTLQDDDRIKLTIPNEIKVEKLNNQVVRTNVTDKLKEYFNKKYDKLLELRDLPNQEKPKNKLEQIQFILKQSGGMDKDYLQEECFTSKQYSKFLTKMVGYFKTNRRNMDETDITVIENDIKTLQTIEARLIKNNKLFNNYRKIQEVHPETLYKDITMKHLEKIIEDNSQLFDQYGNINKNIIDVVNKVERYSQIKEALDTKNSELNKLNSQSGGDIKPYFSSFNNSKEYFTTETFKKVLKEMEEMKDE